MASEVDELWERMNKAMESLRLATLEVDSMQLPDDVGYRYQHLQARMLGSGLLAIAEGLQLQALKGNP